MSRVITVAKVLVVANDSNVLLLRRSETDIRRPLEWDLPGGHTDGDEYANEAAARETLEESGIQLDPRKLQIVYSETKQVADDLTVVWLLFIGRTQDTLVETSDEHDEYCWVSINQAQEMIKYDLQERMLRSVANSQLI